MTMMVTVEDIFDIAMAREVYNEAGITGFWKGIIPTLIMVCNPSIQFMIYESSLKHLRAKRSSNKQGINNVTALEFSDNWLLAKTHKNIKASFFIGGLGKTGSNYVNIPLVGCQGEVTSSVLHDDAVFDMSC
ncbi:hypothetical protein HYC85_009007 [Camellia sinensis]|uniref:Uncharacterized protein n=1 Tax=Camellia sinensis TaxID=4442 RepID=A0A7J7HV92_CAMSI|nr:hypothetical protein HYC85_009007 [Camellia sinensis]